MTTLPTYAETLQHLYGRAGAGMKLGLDTMRELLGLLGNPQHRCGPCVVVAGTNGKGSTTSCIADALRRSGHKVGLYTSPHLLRFAERIRINGVEIADPTVIEAYALIRSVEEHCSRPPTFFECTTAIALYAFAEAQIDVSVLEVGLGGRLDATNVVDKHLAVISPIGLDHTDVLGDTLAQIAAEKAAIIGANRPVVVAPQAPEALRVIRNVAQDRNATLYLLDIKHVLDTNNVSDTQNDPPRLPTLLASYQRLNLRVAAKACQVLHETGISCPPEHIRAAQENFLWPGRFHWIDEHILLDAAHNLAGLEVLLEALKHDPRTKSSSVPNSNRPIHGVFTALRDKPAESLLKRLTPVLKQLHLCPVKVSRSRTVAELRALAQPGMQVHADCIPALAAARQAAEKDGGLVLVTGSIFLVAEALGHLTGAKTDPPVAL
ncbi:MAG: folylpolyglutamate synthase/dihydrofolate synthase family protein [Myxococcota bacterium]